MSDSGKPDAWAVFGPDGRCHRVTRIQREAIEIVAAWNANANSVYRVEPLFRSPALTTTPEQEREAKPPYLVVNGCPCRLVTPCSYACSCADPLQSGGCERCAAYGSLAQRTASAERIARLLASRAPEEGIHG